MASLEDQNSETIRRLFAEMWDKRNPDAADAFYASEAHLASTKQFAANFFASFPDWQMTIRDLIAQGDRIVVHWEGEGTHTGTFNGVEATGRRVSVTGVDISQLSGGRIVADQGIIDWMGLMRQLGAVLITL